MMNGICLFMVEWDIPNWTTMIVEIIVAGFAMGISILFYRREKKSRKESEKNIQAQEKHLARLEAIVDSQQKLKQQQVLNAIKGLHMCLTKSRSVIEHERFPSHDKHDIIEPLKKTSPEDWIFLQDSTLLIGARDVFGIRISHLGKSWFDTFYDNFIILKNEYNPDMIEPLSKFLSIMEWFYLPEIDHIPNFLKPDTDPIPMRVILQTHSECDDLLHRIYNENKPK